jgi:hypothetical protein
MRVPDARETRPLAVRRDWRSKSPAARSPGQASAVKCGPITLPAVGAEWIRFSQNGEDLADEVFVWVEDFQPANPLREADITLGDWLKQNGFSATRSTVWLLLSDGAIAAYHTSQADNCEMPDGTVAEALHCAYAARHHDFAGGGQHIVRHLTELARDDGLAVLTVDPFYKSTERPWEAHGFSPTKTKVQKDPSAEHSGFIAGSDLIRLPRGSLPRVGPFAPCQDCAGRLGLRA